MSITLSNLSARQFVADTRQSIKPWVEFLNTQRFSSPKSLVPLPRRMLKNLSNFRGNYITLFLGLSLFCILTSPLLLVALSLCLGACYWISVRAEKQELVIMGHTLTATQQYGCVGICSFPLFWLAGAGSVVFWVIGASFVIISLHAAFYRPSDEGDGMEAGLEEVSTT